MTIAAELRVDPQQGLSEEEARIRRRTHGRNRLRQIRKKSAWRILAEQFKSLIVLLLGSAAAVCFAIGQWKEAAAIAVVVVINAAIGSFTELRAVRSMEALQKLSRVSARIRRDGEVSEIASEDLVPGDVVVLEAGDMVSADVRLMEASKLQADESMLTGESVPVSKTAEAQSEDAPLAERSSMLFKGTAVTRGAAEGLVVATGMRTELGRISSLVEEAEEGATPLEKRLDRLGRKLIWVTLAIAAATAASGIAAGRDIFLMIETSIALAVAAIPEGLPIVATIALARGMWRMARRKAIINRLSAVETLGAASVIFTDKTGTLTENRMTVSRLALGDRIVDVTGEGLETRGEFKDGEESIVPSESSILGEALRIGVLCNNAVIGGDGRQKAVGDPLEVALLVAGAKAGMTRDELAEGFPEIKEHAFDPEVKMMATVHNRNGGFEVAVKGAPEAVLDACTAAMSEDGGAAELDAVSRSRRIDLSNEMAGEGLRMIALARKRADSADAEPYRNLTFVGLAGLIDPPRSDVREAISETREAGIRVVMVTGDQAHTARYIASKVGLVEEGLAPVLGGDDIKDLSEAGDERRRRLLAARIFARVSPEQKLDLIGLYQKEGAVVAMTGDGVNDAPALKKADIGVAMGMRGTQVAREAADMVLKDDSFATIAAAVEQGRAIFNNIRKFAVYLISCNVSEIAAVGLASIVNAPLPILPLQILFLNMVTDVLPALALGVGEGGAALMKHPPRDPKEGILTRRHWVSIGVYGLFITASVLAALGLSLKWLDLDRQSAVTVSFLTLAFAQLWHVFNMRNRESRLLANDITRNRFVWGALALCSGLLLAAVYIPGVSAVLQVVAPGGSGWLLVAAMSLVPLALGQLWNAVYPSSGSGNRSAGKGAP